MKKIDPDMTVLDVLSACRETEDVFKEYDKETGGCLCCEALFESVRDAAVKYRLDLDNLLDQLNRRVEEQEKG